MIWRWCGSSGPTIATPGTTEATFRARHADGTWRWLEASGTVVVRQGVPSIVLVGRDITERKRAEMALAEERNLLRTLIDTLPDEIYIKDVQSRFLNANIMVAHAMSVSTPDQVIGKTDFDFHPYEEMLPDYLAEQAIIQSGQPMINCETYSPDTQLWRLEWYQMRAFVDAIRNGTPVLTGPEDAVKNMEVIDAIYRAAGLQVREPTP